MQKICTLLSVLFFSSLASAQDQPQTAVGGPGESCRARSDCKAGLKCVDQTCVDEHEGQTCGATSDCGGELKCIENKCVGSNEWSGGSGGGKKKKKKDSDGDGGGDDWLNFKLEGAHPFAGITLGGGFMTQGATGNLSGGFSTFNGDFMFALQGGVFIDNHQLQVDISPFTYIFNGKASGPAFQVTGSYAYFIPLYDSNAVKVYWPLRFGVGMVAGANNTLGLVLFQPRADLIGAAIQIGHVMIDMHLPSFRYAFTDRAGFQIHLLDWVFGASASYVF